MNTMDTPNKNMYHFVWNDEDEDATFDQPPPSLSPKERVAKILRETELPDLIFKGSANDKVKGKEGRGSKKPAPLKTDQELFTIGDLSDDAMDDDFDINTDQSLVDSKPRGNIYKGPVDSNDHPQISHSRIYNKKPPALQPPQVKSDHPTRTTLNNNQLDGHNAPEHGSTYIDRTTLDESIMTGHNKKENSSALLPLEKDFLEMELDETDSGMNVYLDRPADRQPIVTVDQTELNLSYQRRRRRTHTIVGVVLIVLGIGVIVTAVVFVIKVMKTDIAKQPP